MNLINPIQEIPLYDKLKNIVKEFSGTGGIIIIETRERNKIAQYGLSPKKIRENLCLAIYYSEKIVFDEQQGKSI